MHSKRQPSWGPIQIHRIDLDTHTEIDRQMAPHGAATKAADGRCAIAGMSETETDPPTRVVHHGDGLAWLAERRLPADHAIVTSMPDVSELPGLGYEGWRQWFIDTAALVCRTVDDAAVALFYQTDIKHDGRWIDKSHLVQIGADAASSHVLWHKIACRVPPGTTTFGRPAYAHLLALSRDWRLTPGESTPDVLPGLGTMPWSRAMGVDVCRMVARFLIEHTPCRVVVDPFCGVGTMLAAANEAGLHAIGVELSRRRASRARSFVLVD
jgi:hypothetical protein